MADVTPERIAELRRLCEAATEGPWEGTDGRGIFRGSILAQGCTDTYDGSVWSPIFRAELVYAQDNDGRTWYTSGSVKANIAFVVAARTALPDLLTALEDALRQRDEAREERDELLKAAGWRIGSLSKNGELGREVILNEFAGYRPAMVKARREADRVQGDADLWTMRMLEEWPGDTLLLRLWRQKKEAVKSADAAESALATEKQAREEAESRFARLIAAGKRDPYVCADYELRQALNTLDRERDHAEKVACDLSRKLFAAEEAREEAEHHAAEYKRLWLKSCEREKGYQSILEEARTAEAEFAGPNYADMLQHDVEVAEKNERDANARALRAEADARQLREALKNAQDNWEAQETPAPSAQVDNLPFPPPQDRWPDPTPEMCASPAFEAIWQVIKSWDVNVPGVYEGYCGATGNHVRAILDALAAAGLLRDAEPVSVGSDLEEAADEIERLNLELDDALCKLDAATARAEKATRRAEVWRQSYEAISDRFKEIAEDAGQIVERVIGEWVKAGDKRSNRDLIRRGVEIALVRADTLARQLAETQKALQFYADPESWTPFEGRSLVRPAKAIFDKGERARAALGDRAKEG